MRRTTKILLAAVCIGAFAATAGAATELARINGKIITLEYFNKKYNESVKYLQFQSPTKTAVLDDMIKRELGIQEAKRMRLNRDPEVIERMNTVLYHALLEKNLAKQFNQIHISDKEAKAFYDDNPEIRTSHIFVRIAPGSGSKGVDHAKKKIEEIYTRYVKPGKMSFAEVAQRYSEGLAAPMGGDLDYKTKDQLDPAYYAAAVALGKPGRVSGPVRSQFGFHIIKLTGLRTWSETDRAKIKRLVFEQHRQKIFEKYMAGLMGKAKIKVNKSLLKE